MQNEYVIWGLTAEQVLNSDLDEQVLYTKAKSMREAHKIMRILKEKHDCYATRVQVIDGAIPDFAATIAK